jgi:hypothetical protein
MKSTHHGSLMTAVSPLHVMPPGWENSTGPPPDRPIRCFGRPRPSIIRTAAKTRESCPQQHPSRHSAISISPDAFTAS